MTPIRPDFIHSHVRCDITRITASHIFMQAGVIGAGAITLVMGASHRLSDVVGVILGVRHDPGIDLVWLKAQRSPQGIDLGDEIVR